MADRDRGGKPAGAHASIEVHPGDDVVADECGVCSVSCAGAAEVLATAQRLARSEKARLQKKLAEGIPLSDFIRPA